MSPSELFLKIASPAVVLIAGFVFICLSALFFTLNPRRAIEARFKEALNHDLFLRTGTSLYSPRRLYSMLDAYAEADDRAEYKSIYLDFIYALTYALALGVIIVYLQNEFRPPNATVSSYPVLIPLAATLSACLANLSLYLLLRRYQTAHTKAPALVFFATAMTALKILLWVASLLIIIAGILKRVFE